MASLVSQGISSAASVLTPFVHPHGNSNKADDIAIENLVVSAKQLESILGCVWSVVIQTHTTMKGMQERIKFLEELVLKLATKIDPQFVEQEKMNELREQAEKEAAQLEEEFVNWKSHQDYINGIREEAKQKQQQQQQQKETKESVDGKEFNLKPNDRVFVYGLKSQTEYNNRYGRIVNGPFGGRYEVKTIDGESILIKKSNLKKVSQTEFDNASLSQQNNNNNNNNQQNGNNNHQQNGNNNNQQNETNNKQNGSQTLQQTKSKSQISQISQNNQNNQNNQNSSFSNILFSVLHSDYPNQKIVYSLNQNQNSIINISNPITIKFEDSSLVDIPKIGTNWLPQVAFSINNKKQFTVKLSALSSLLFNVQLTDNGLIEYVKVNVNNEELNFVELIEIIRKGNNKFTFEKSFVLSNIDSIKIIGNGINKKTGEQQKQLIVLNNI